MRPMVEFCEGNLESHSESVRIKLQADGDLDIMEYGCLGNCGECYVQPFAYVNGKRIAAETAEELYLEIKNFLEKIKEEEEAWKGLGL
ncbi:MAG TPA: UDP-N-acetylmuramoylalanine--D-glutamate ligase [Paenibacillaceae bacterium]|nr:UDP-N-acetylmuramoylalanine--D-glutamate ligase [Paenibacillaceae bacterium]